MNSTMAIGIVNLITIIFFAGINYNKLQNHDNLLKVVNDRLDKLEDVKSAFNRIDTQLVIANAEISRLRSLFDQLITPILKGAASAALDK